MFIEQVTGPALRVPGGVERILALADADLEYSENRVFQGGCFFAAASSELGSRPGPVRDAVLAAMSEWYDFVQYTVRRAVQRGDLDADPDQLTCRDRGRARQREPALALYGSSAPYRPGEGRGAPIARSLTAPTVET